MAMTIAINRERGAPAPAFPRDVHRRQVVVLLCTLTAGITLAPRLTPEDWLWLYNLGPRITGHPELASAHPPQFQDELESVYCYPFWSLSLPVVFLLLLLPRIQDNQRIKWYAFPVDLILRLLCLVGYYLAMSSMDFMVSICLLLFFIAIQIPVLLCKPRGISLSRVKGSPQKSPKSLPSKKRKYVLKVEQKNHQQQNITISGQSTGDAYQILKKSRMHMLLLGTLVASVTYQAGLNDIWQGEAHYDSNEHPILHSKKYLVFFCWNASAFVVSLAIIVMLILSSIFSTQGIKYYCVLQFAVTLDLFCLIGAYVAVTLDWFCLIRAYVAGVIWQLLHPVYFTLLVALVSIVVYVIALWQMAQCMLDWLKKLFGMPTRGHAEGEEEEGDDEEEDEVGEEDEEGVSMELKLEHWRKLLLMLAILATILAYHAISSPPLENLVNYRRLAFSYCEATVFIVSLSIIAMLANRKLPAARGVRWHVMRVCVILDVIGLTGTFAARGYWKISMIDVLVLVLVVLLCVVFHVALSIPGTPRGLMQNFLSKLGLLPVFAGPDPLQDEGTQHDFEFGITGGTNEEPLGVEIASPILGGALTLIVAVPVISIVAIPVKLLVAIMIATIGVALWQRSLARLFLPLARALQHRQGSTSPTDSSTPPEHGLCKLIHTLSSETWMWIIILVMWVPSLRPNIKLKLKMSRIFAVLSMLVDNTPTPETTIGTEASTTTTTTMVTPSTATSTVVSTPIMADAPGGTEITTNASGTPIGVDASGTRITGATPGTSMDRGVRPLVELRPRRIRRANSRLIGPDWVN
jgi:hypothetical protein